MSRRRSPRDTSSSAGDTTGQTCSCGQAVHDGTYLCARCVKTLSHALTNVGAFYEDLWTLRTKSVRYSTSGPLRGSVGKDRPIGVDLRFVGPSRADYRNDYAAQVPGREGQGTELVHNVRNAVTTWARVCLEEWSSLATPADNVPACCALLRACVTAIAGQPWAEELMREMLRLEQALVRMVDRPADRWYAGKCWELRDEQTRCDQELYATTDTGKIRCRACGTEHDVAERRDVLLEEAKEILVTATEGAAALIAWTDYDGSESKLVDLIRKWRDRDRLEVRDVTSLRGQDRHLYRLGDVQDLLVERAQRDQARRIRVPV